MTRPDRSRLDFTRGGLLTADDFLLEQAYHLQTQALRCSSLHSWGVADGLEVTLGAGATVVVAPGMAVDPRGRQILLQAAATIDLSNQFAPSVYLYISLDTALSDWRIDPKGAGFTRAVEGPIFPVFSTRPLQNDSLVPLALLTFTPERRLRAPDLSVRILCGLDLGQLTLSTPDVIDSPPTLALDGDGALRIASPLSDLFGSLVVDGAVAVAPLGATNTAALSVSPAGPSPGADLISSSGAAVFGTDPYALASLTAGDTLQTPWPDTSPAMQSLTVASVAGQVVTLTQPPASPLDKASYAVTHGQLLRVRTNDITTALDISTAGQVGIGGPPGAALLTVSGGDVRIDGGSLLRFGADGVIESQGGATGSVHALQFLPSQSRLAIAETGGIVFDQDGPGGAPGMILLPSQNIGIGTADPASRLTVDGEVRASQGVIFGDNSVQTAGVASIPVGTIVNWWRPNAQTNWAGTGFQLCDGSTITDPASPLVGLKTPDLRNAFVRGAVNYEQIGQTGGSATHTHTIALAQHTHRIDHTHAVTGTTTSVIGTAGDNIAGSSVSKDDHVHSITVSSGNCSPLNSGPNPPVSGGATLPAASLPPYITLLKAMRIK